VDEDLKKNRLTLIVKVSMDNEKLSGSKAFEGIAK
jgi:hypothetical protein